MMQRPFTVLLVLCVAICAKGAAAAPKLTVNAKSFTNNKLVTVTLSGVVNPAAGDVIALYPASGTTPNPLEERPFKYKWCTSVTTYLKTGKATFSFRLLQQRRDLIFVFYKGVTPTTGFQTKELQATTHIITNANPNEPVHGHLALTGKPGQMLVQFTTRNAGKPIVLWGTSPTKLTHTVKAGTTTYTRKQMCGSPANTTGWVDPGHLHRATIAGLKHNTFYYYKFGSTAHGFSKVFKFKTAPPTGATQTVKFLAIADLGHTELDDSHEYDYDPSGDLLNYAPDNTNYDALQTIEQIINDNAYQQAGSRKTVNALAKEAETGDYSLFLLNGDVSYARGEQVMWDVFMDQLEAVGARVPWMLVEGNHERDFLTSGDRYNGTAIDSGGECGVSYSTRLHMPINAPKFTSIVNHAKNVVPSYYSYDYGPIHFLSYSTELPFKKGSPQYKFLAADLAKVDRSKTPWVVLNGHRPIYTTSSSCCGVESVIRVSDDLRAALEDLLFTYEVDVTWQGHDHVYERTCAIYKHKCQPKNKDGSESAPTHVVIGNAGYELSWFANPYPPSFWQKIAIEHGYLRCEVTQTKFHCQEISSISGKLLDEWTLKKPKGWKPNKTRQEERILSFKDDYKPLTFIETSGVIGSSYGQFLPPLYEALGANTALLSSIVKADELLHRRVDYAIEEPDTLVDDWETLKPAYEVLKAIAANKTNGLSPEGNLYLKNGFLPILEMVKKGAAAYSKASGIWHAADGNYVAGKVTPLTA